MASTLTSLLVHIVFSTKSRAELIVPDVEDELYGYMGGICRNLGSPLLKIGGVADHVHLLVSLSKRIAVADLVMDIKKDSSKWIKGRRGVPRSFGWQDGYGGFTIGESQREALVRYIDRQKERHRRMTYRDELEALCRKYRVKFERKYLLD